MISVGFSTQRGNVVSWLIRKLTGSEASHTWLLIDDPLFGIPMVLEATEVGFRLIPYVNFKQKNDVVAVLDPGVDMSAGIRAMASLIGSRYDVEGLFGMVVVLAGRWMHRVWRNPFRGASAMFCSEAVVRALRASGHREVHELLDVDSTTPQDLLQLLRRAP